MRGKLVVKVLTTDFTSSIEIVRRVFFQITLITFVFVIMKISEWPIKLLCSNDKFIQETRKNQE